MANKDDYLTEYRKFFEYFAETVNPHDQLPVKLSCYKLVNVEVVGGIIDWTTQYLTQKRCPENLIAPLIKTVIDEMRKACKKHPVACGFNTSDEAYEPLKLMQCVMAKTNEVCLRYLDNSMLCSLPSPGPPYNVVSVFALKNLRRKMEDRHVVVHDLNTMFNLQKTSPSSYYAIFDGHAGHDAAAYSSAHLHQFLAESKYFIHNPEQALIDAFCKTDALFIDKCKVEKLSSGTTAVCALFRPKEKTLYIAWAGDSQALLVNQGKVLQCVAPHKPSREDEKNRIEQQGGVVLYWGTWRVNGQLAVSRAIGDAEYKPYVTAMPDVQEITLTGGEDFLILACDGLWDFLSEDDAALAVYNMVCSNPDDTESISHHLAQLAKQQGSTDNISVIVVFLREPSKVAADALWANRNRLTMETGLDNANATNNPFANSNGSEILQQKDGFLLNLTENFKQNGSETPSNDYVFDRPANGKRLEEEFDEDEDMGPETDVDALDDALLSPASEQTNIIDNKNLDSFDPFTTEMEEKATFEMDFNIQKQQTSEFDPPRIPREETPTPPADEVHDAGVEENVADSAEDSEDEWNYYKGDTAESEQVSSSKADQEVAELTRTAEEDENEDDDSMSQLNPNAAEFVPISSPTRNVASPACRTLLNEQVIAQSPRRATPSDIDINLPDQQDFEKEVKSRPSDVYSNGQDDENLPRLTSQEVMENLLNGKNIEDIEFHPSTPQKISNTEEFHFGPNATPFSTPAKFLDQSEAGLSTKAVFGDESSYLEGKTLAFETSLTTETTTVNPNIEGEDAIDFRSQINKPTDPMSMSFYQDESETNPFDLNKVQMLPDDDDLLEKPENNGSFNETISDLPEHEPLAKNEPVVTDLDKPAESGDAQSLVDDSNLLFGVSKLPETPEPELNIHEEKYDDDCISGDSPPAKSPILIEASKAPLPITPEPNSEEQEQISSAPKTPEAASPLPQDNLLVDLDKRPSSVSPTPIQSFNPIEEIVICEHKPQVLSDLLESTADVPQKETITPIALSPELTYELNKLSKSPEPTDEVSHETFDPLNRPASRSPAIRTPEPTEELCQINSPEPFDLKGPSPIPISEPTTESCEDVLSHIPEKGEEVQEEFFPICDKPKEPEKEIKECITMEEEFFPICSKPQTTESSITEQLGKLEDDIMCQISGNLKDEIQSKSHVPIDDVSEDLSESLVPKIDTQLLEFAVDVEIETKPLIPDITEGQSKSPLLDLTGSLSKSPIPDISESLSKSPIPDVAETVSKSPLPDMVETLSKSPIPDITECQSPISSVEEVQPIPSADIMYECPVKSPELGIDVLAESEIKSSEIVANIDETPIMDVSSEDILVESEIKQCIGANSTSTDQDPDVAVECKVISPGPTDILVEREVKSSEPILFDLIDPAKSPEPRSNDTTALLKEDLKTEKSSTIEFEEHRENIVKSPELEISPVDDFEVCNLPDNNTVITAEAIQSFKETAHLTEQAIIDEIQNILDSTEPVIPIESEAKSPETVEESLDSEKRDLESPMEDITSSVKDDNSISPEIIEEAKDISTEKETVKEHFEMNEIVSEKEIVCQISSTPNTTISEQTDTESVKTTDVNSFLDRSNMPDITSPLSSTEQTLEKIIDAQLDEVLSKSPLPTEDVIKTDLITPQYPEETVITPSEETKPETPTPTVEEKEAPAALPEVALEAQEKEKGDESVVAATAVTAVVATAAAAATVAAVKEKKTLSKPLTKTTSTAKKPTTKLGPSLTKSAAPSKPATARTPTSTKPAVSSPTKPVPPKTSKSTTTTLKAPPKMISKSSPKPKIEALATKLPEKKSAINGDVKPSAKVPVAAAKKITSTTATKTSLTAKSPLTPKSSPIKMDTKSSVTKVSSTSSTKSSAVASTLKTTSSSKTTTTAAPKARPTSLPGKTTTGSSSSTKTTPTVTATKATVQPKTTTTASSPKSTSTKSKQIGLGSKLSTTSAIQKPKSPRVSAVKGPDTEKQIKESVNKQLTASRSTTTARFTGTLAAGKTTTIKKTEIKIPSTRTTTRTTVTTIKSTNKKPTEVTSITKRTGPTKTTLTKTHQNGLTNGVTTIVQETTTILSTEPQLIKDMSPIENKLIVDNSQLTETTNIAD